MPFWSLISELAPPLLACLQLLTITLEHFSSLIPCPPDISVERISQRRDWVKVVVVLTLSPAVAGPVVVRLLNGARPGPGLPHRRGEVLGAVGLVGRAELVGLVLGVRVDRVLGRGGRRVRVSLGGRERERVRGRRAGGRKIAEAERAP